MPKVNTRDRIIEAAARLFAEHGYQKTSIARIETEAGLVPRAGAFYRHFDSKETLLAEVARTHVSETPEEFGLEHLADFGDTRAELVAIALKYEEAMKRQQPFTRLIEEVRSLDFGSELQSDLNTAMMVGLEQWISDKPAARELSRPQRLAQIISVLGGWLFYLSLLNQDARTGELRDTLINDWASRWAAILDAE